MRKRRLSAPKCFSNVRNCGAASGVPAQTQLEILEALGQLGAAVKSHLIDATKASLFQVRRRAIEMLLPHLSDDELFGLEHVLDDRSKKPIKALACITVPNVAAGYMRYISRMIASIYSREFRSSNVGNLSWPTTRSISS